MHPLLYADFTSPLGSVRPENSAMSSAGNEGKKFVVFSLKLRRSGATALRALYGYRAVPGPVGQDHVGAIFADVGLRTAYILS